MIGGAVGIYMASRRSGLTGQRKVAGTWRRRFVDRFPGFCVREKILEGKVWRWANSEARNQFPVLLLT
jgi:hypothetical protein